MKNLTREKAIQEMRHALLDLVDEDHSICEVVGEKHIFCHGFKQWTDTEMFRKFRWIAERRGVQSRKELETMANRWHLQRQQALGLPIACDAQQTDHDQCWGWDEFSNGQLEQFYRELLEEPVEIR